MINNLKKCSIILIMIILCTSVVACDSKNSTLKKNEELPVKEEMQTLKEPEKEFPFKVLVSPVLNYDEMYPAYFQGGNVWIVSKNNLYGIITGENKLIHSLKYKSIYVTQNHILNAVDVEDKRVSLLPDGTVGEWDDNEILEKGIYGWDNEKNTAVFCDEAVSYYVIPNTMIVKEMKTVTEDDNEEHVALDESFSGKYGVADEKGLILPCEYDALYYGANQYMKINETYTGSACNYGDIFVFVKDGKMGHISKNGKIITPPEFDVLSCVDNGYFAFKEKESENWGIGKLEDNK